MDTTHIAALAFPARTRSAHTAGAISSERQAIDDVYDRLRYPALFDEHGRRRKYVEMK